MWLHKFSFKWYYIIFLSCALKAKTGSSHEFLEAEIHGTETNAFQLNTFDAGFCISLTSLCISVLFFSFICTRWQDVKTFQTVSRKKSCRWIMQGIGWKYLSFIRSHLIQLGADLKKVRTQKYVHKSCGIIITNFYRNCQDNY